MYDINISLARNDWLGIEAQTDAKTTVVAFMDAIRLVRRLLHSNEVEFLPISQTEFAIWSQGKWQGMLLLKEVGPETSVQGLGKG